MSTDTFVLKTPRRIEALEDVFDPYFEKVRFVMTTNGLFFNYVQQSNENTRIGQVYQKLASQSDCSRLSTCNFLEFEGNFGSAQQLEVLNILKDVSEQGGMASFVSDELIMHMMIPAVCRMEPDLIKLLYTGPEVLTEDIMINLMRNDIDEQVDSYLRYVDAAQFEFNLVWMNAVENVHAAFDALSGDSRDLNYLQCISRSVAQEDTVLEDTGLAAYERLAVNSCYILVGAFLVFTLQPIESLGVGYRLDNGSYTGLLGELMRNRSDIAVCGTVLSSSNFPGIEPGPALSSLSLKAHSQVKPKVLEPTDVLTSIQTLPLEFKIYLFVVVHIVAGIGFRATENGISQYTAASFQAIRYFVSQGDLETDSSARATLRLHLSIFAFVTVFGYILNMMSTDAFVLKQSRRIETLADAFDPYFDDVRFIIFKNDLFFNYVHQTNKTTTLSQVYDKMRKESDCSHLSTCSLVEFDGQLGSSQQLEAFEIAKNASERGGMATFATDELLELFILPTLCRFQPGMAKMVYTGPQVFTEDIMVNAMRSNIDKQVGRYLTLLCLNSIWRG
ncbi:hypothetical protein HDE_09559 [Halotydeus destructor]|nr:hypothetical protein HDE_09559 [Halotydeus destructor]